MVRAAILQIEKDTQKELNDDAILEQASNMIFSLMKVSAVGIPTSFIYCFVIGAETLDIFLAIRGMKQTRITI